MYVHLSFDPLHSNIVVISHLKHQLSLCHISSISLTSNMHIVVTTVSGQSRVSLHTIAATMCKIVEKSKSDLTNS